MVTFLRDGLDGVSYAPYHDKIISFSLWGDNECYNYMALENAIVAQTLYPGWMCYFFHNSTCMPKIITALQRQPNVRLILIDDPISKASNTFWRFIPCFESDGVVLVRDSDSILNERERVAVLEFMDSDRLVHIMRDNLYHRQKIMAGMWGCRNGVLKPLRSEYNAFIRAIDKDDDRRSIDEKWLDTYVYPRVTGIAMIHASANKYESECRPFPKTEYRGIVGGIILYAPLARGYLGEENKKLRRRPAYVY